MSTRATYQFRDDAGNDFTVYKHHDGYPEGGLQWIAKALKNAWPLPRFEADEFAAAFIAANKERPGDITLTTDRDAHGDTEWHYVVTAPGGILPGRGVLRVQILQSIDRDWKDGRCDWREYAAGPLETLLAKYAPKRQWMDSAEQVTPPIVVKVARQFSACGPCIPIGAVVRETAKFLVVADDSCSEVRERRIAKGSVHCEPCVSCRDHPQTQYPNGYMD